MYRPMPIDHTLHRLEQIADRKGLKLEDVAGYVRLCEFLTDIDLEGSSKLRFSRADCLAVLKALIAWVAPEWVGHEMEFHMKCQPETSSKPTELVSNKKHNLSF